MLNKENIKQTIKALIYAALGIAIMSELGIPDIKLNTFDFGKGIFETTNIPRIHIVMYIIMFFVIRGYVYIVQSQSFKDKVDSVSAEKKGLYMLVFIIIGVSIALTPFLVNRYFPPTLKPPYKTCTYKNIKYEKVSVTLEEAINISKDSSCALQGEILESGVCNSNTSTWWVDMKSKTLGENCLPACIVNIKTGGARFDGRCSN